MSSFLCFICHNTVSTDINEEIREKYRDLVGINLCMDSHMCYVCCHLLNKLWSFKSICYKRALEYPVLFSAKGTPNLQTSDIQLHVLCPEICTDQYTYNDSIYVKLGDPNIDITHTNHYDNIAHNDNFVIDSDKIVHDDFVKTITANDCGNIHDNVVSDKMGYDVSVRTITANDFGNITHDIDVSDKTGHEFLRTDDRNYGNVINYTDNPYIDNIGNDCIMEYVNNDGINNDKVMENSNNIGDDTSNENYVNIGHVDQIGHDVNEMIDDCNEYDESEYNDNDFVMENNDVVDNDGISKEIDTEPGTSKKKTKSKRNKKKYFEKIILTKEEQKKDLELQRKTKKFKQAEFKCFNCALGFLFKDTCQAHMMRHEESNGEFKCVTCKLRFATQALLRSHIVLHTERYKCTKCDEVLRCTQVQRHTRICHNKKTESVACHLCGRVFTDSKALQQHLKRFHMSKTSNKTYSCNVCGNNFNNPAAVRTHMLKHIQRKFTCEQCDAIFTSPYNLSQHKKKHENSTDDKQFYCETCGVGYTTKKSLLAHKRNSSAHQTREYFCPICNRSCPNEKSLSDHISNIHTGTKDFTCTFCTSRYSNRKSLLRHIRAHTQPPQVKLAICHLCGNSFKGKSKLNRHLKEVCEKNKLEEELASYYEQNPL